MTNDGSVVLAYKDAADILRVLAGIQGMLLAGAVPSDALIGSSLADLGIDRTSPEAIAAFLAVIERLIDGLRRAGV